jgi:hypothetical protein
MEPVSRARDWPQWLVWLPTLAVTLVLALVDSADALRAGLAAVFDYRASNIGDPWPSVVAAGRLLAHPRTPLYASFTADGSSFIYPPIAAALMLPFARMSYEQAHFALSLVSRCAYLGCLLLTVALAIGQGARRVTVVACAVVLATSFYPLLRAVQLNQSTLLVALCFGSAVLFVTKGRDATAGVLLGVTAVLKPQMVLVVGLLYWHSRRLALAGIGAVAAAGVTSIACAGISDHVDYVTRILPRLSAGYAFFPNQCWTGAILRAVGEPFADFALPTPSIGARVAALVMNLATLLIAAVVLRTAARNAARPSSEALVVAIGFAWVMVTLASPVSWEHHYTPSMFLFAFLVAKPSVMHGHARFAAAAAYPLVASYVEVRGFSSFVGRLASSYTVLGALFLAVAFAMTLRGHRHSAAR